MFDEICLYWPMGCLCVHLNYGYFNLVHVEEGCAWSNHWMQIDIQMGPWFLSSQMLHVSGDHRGEKGEGRLMCHASHSWYNPVCFLTGASRMMVVNFILLNILTVYDSNNLISTFPFQLAEYRISIYGRKQSEWDQLGSWFVNNGLYSENAVWLIQVTYNATFSLSPSGFLK